MKIKLWTLSLLVCLLAAGCGHPLTTADPEVVQKMKNPKRAQSDAEQFLNQLEATAPNQLNDFLAKNKDELRYLETGPVGLAPKQAADVRQRISIILSAKRSGQPMPPDTSS